MKVKLVILGLLLLSSLAWAEHGFLSTIPIVHPLFGQLYQYEPKGVYPLPDGSMYVLGTAGWFDDINGIPWMYGAVVTLLDPNGNLVWHRYPLEMGAERRVTFIDIDDDLSLHFIICIGRHYFISKVDRFGVVSVGPDHSFPNYSLIINSAKRLANDEILMAGEHFSNAILARLTASGDTISVARYSRDPDSGTAGIAIYDLEFDNDGNVLNLCKLSSLIHATILKTDIDGNIISRHDWLDNNYISAIPIKYLGLGSNGGYEILMLATYNASHTDPLICLYDNGEILYVDNLDYFSDSFLLSFIRSGNSRYSVTWNATGTSLNKTSLSGDILWAWQDDRDWEFSSRYNNCITLYGDRVIAVGFGIDGYNLFAVELLPNGQVENQDELQSPVVNIISAYPNPMKDKLTINTKRVAGANTMLFIFNIRGQRIRSMILNGDTAEWDGKDARGADCPNGVYAIRLASNNAVSYVTKIK